MRFAESSLRRPFLTLRSLGYCRLIFNAVPRQRASKLVAITADSITLGLTKLSSPYQKLTSDEAYEIALPARTTRTTYTTTHLRRFNLCQAAEFMLRQVLDNTNIKGFRQNPRWTLPKKPPVSNPLPRGHTKIPNRNTYGVHSYKHIGFSKPMQTGPNTYQ